MSFYEPQGWQAPVRQTSWEQQPPPSRSGASSTSQREDGPAFATQFEEVDRAIDNLVKSGKLYSPGFRRDTMPVPMMSGAGRQYGEFGPRAHGGRHSVSDFDPSRTHSASNLQNFYASQRYQGGRQNEAEQMMQAKRRMAAQRERELRNYHQEQQYNRSVLSEMASNKSDRSMSPSTLSEEGRRELIARQHRALYGSDSPAYPAQTGFGDDAATHEQSISASGAPSISARGASPRGIDMFGMSSQSSQGEALAQSNLQEASRPEKTTSPSGQTASGKIPTPPIGEEGSHSRQISKSTTAPLTSGMAPIGSRPNAQHVPVQSLSKKTTSPLPSPLNYGFGSGEHNNERSSSSNSNGPKESTPNPGMGAWGTGSGVWGSNKIGATSVWG